jgi:F0F1-type ATP synthase assembly protein I
VLGPRGGKQYPPHARHGAVALALSVATVIGYIAGPWLDQKLDTGPWLGLVGLLLGVAAGNRRLIRPTKREAERMRQSDDTDNQVDRDNR